MKRQAVLVVSGKDGEMEMTSFENDLSFMQTFLKSTNGGYCAKTDYTDQLIPDFILQNLIGLQNPIALIN